MSKGKDLPLSTSILFVIAICTMLGVGFLVSQGSPILHDSQELKNSQPNTPPNQLRPESSRWPKANYSQLTLPDLALDPSIFRQTKGSYSFSLTARNLIIEKSGEVLKMITLSDIPPQSTAVSKGGDEGLDDPTEDYIFGIINEKDVVLFDEARERVYFKIYNKHNSAPFDLKVMLYAYSIESDTVSLVIKPSFNLPIKDLNIAPDFQYLIITQIGLGAHYDKNCVGLSNYLYSYDLLSGSKSMNIEVPIDERRIKSFKSIGWRNGKEFVYQVFKYKPILQDERFLDGRTNCVLEEEKVLTF
ncbi:MAG: hypothetical protein AAB691_02270 [Patescibacteria group bacterium]